MKKTVRTCCALLVLAMVLGLLPGMSGMAHADGHQHHFTYSASGDTITATCDVDGCTLPENKVTLTIVATTNLYALDGLSKEASLVGLEEYNAATGFNLSTDNIIYLKGDSSFSTAKIKNGTAGVSSGYQARIAYNGTDNFGSKVAKVSFALTAKPTPHTHVYSYSVQGNVITATCTQNAANMEPCDLLNHEATLTLNAPLHQVYGDGLNANATFTGEIPGVNTPVINYRRSSSPLGTTAPIDASDYAYVAWCQIGNVTASVEYTISKAVNQGWSTMPHAEENLVYSGQAQALIAAGVPSAGSALYTVGLDADNEPDTALGGRPYTSSVPEMTNAGTYYVWCKIDGGKNYTSIGPQSVAVTIAPAQSEIAQAPTASDIILGQALSNSTLTGGTANVPGTFAWKDGTTVPALTDSQTTAYTVVFTPDDTANYEGAETTVTLTVIDPDQVAADGVADTIGQLPETVTLDSKDAIEAARAAYEALTPAQKEKVSPDTLQKLTDAEAALQLLQDKAAFADYIAQKAKEITDSMTDWDSDEAKQKAKEYSDDIAALVYDETKTLAENLAQVDTKYQQAQEDLGELRVNPYVVLGVKSSLTSPIEGKRYQWQYQRPGSPKWRNASGSSAKKQTYVFTPKMKQDGYVFRCRIQQPDKSYVYTPELTIHVLAIAPTVTLSPEAVTNAISSSKVTLHAEGQDYASFRWQVRKPGASKWSNVGSKNKDLTVTASAKTNGYQYRCAFINPTGTVYSDVTELVVELVAPKITAQPEDVTAAVKAKATFTVAAEGAQKYVWYYQAPGTDTWKKASGGSRATLKVSVKADMNGYRYRCDVSNADGTTTSDIATLTVE